MTNPMFSKFMIGHKAECPKCGGMIGTFIPQVPGVAVQAETCAVRLASTADTQVPPGHACGLEPCPNSHQQHFWSQNKNTNSHHGQRGPRGRKRQCFDHSRHFSSVVGVCSGTRERVTREIERWHHPAKVSPSTTRIPVCFDGQSLEIIASFTCCRTNVGKMRTYGLRLRQAEVQTRECRHVSR